MKLKVIYEAQKGNLGLGFYIGLVLLVISLLLCIFFWRRAAFSGKIFQVILVCASILLIISGINSYKDYLKVYNQYVSGNYEIIEGEIEGYLPLNEKEGRKYDSFLVQGVEFSVPCLFGYSVIQEQGSPLGNGVYVRICYITHAFENEILKIEVREE